MSKWWDFIREWLSDWWDTICEGLRGSLGPPLKTLLGPLDSFFDGLPMWAAQATAIGLFVLAGLWAWMLPRDFVYLGAPDRARWRDLRIWATVVLLPYIFVYLWLGR